MKLEHYIELSVPAKCWLFTCKRKQGFLFDMYAWFLMYRDYGTDIPDVRKLNPEELISRMIYTAAVSACKEQGRRIWFTRQDVATWIDLMPNGDIKRLGSVFTESMHLMGKVAADAQKKTTAAPSDGTS